MVIVIVIIIKNIHAVTVALVQRISILVFLPPGLRMLLHLLESRINQPSHKTRDILSLMFWPRQAGR